MPSVTLDTAPQIRPLVRKAAYVKEDFERGVLYVRHDVGELTVVRCHSTCDEHLEGITVRRHPLWSEEDQIQRIDCDMDFAIVRWPVCSVCEPDALPHEATKAEYQAALDKWNDRWGRIPRVKLGKWRTEPPDWERARLYG